MKSVVIFFHVCYLIPYCLCLSFSFFFFLLAIKDNCPKTVKSHNPFINYNENVFAVGVVIIIAIVVVVAVVAGGGGVVTATFHGGIMRREILCVALEEKREAGTVLLSQRHHIAHNPLKSPSWRQEQQQQQ